MASGGHSGCQRPPAHALSDKKYLQKTYATFLEAVDWLFLVWVAIIDIYMLILKILGHDIWENPSCSSGSCSPWPACRSLQ